MYETDDKKKNTEPVMIYGKKPEETQAPATAQATQETKPQVAVEMPEYPTASVSAKDPYEDYMKDLRSQHASSLEEIRRRRRELDEKYQPSIDRQRKVMKIMALGKLVGALAQFGGNLAGGGGGAVAKDPDPYMINAWKRLDADRAEYKAYGKQLDEQEKALNKSMQDALSKAQMKRAESVNKRTEQLERFQASLYLKAYDRQTKAQLQELKNWYDKQMFNAKTDWEREKLQKQYAYNLSLIDARLGAALTRQNNAAQNAITQKELGAEIAANTPTTDQKNATDPEAMTANRNAAVNRARNKVGGASANGSNNPDDY